MYTGAVLTNRENNRVRMGLGIVVLALSSFMLPSRFMPPARADDSRPIYDRAEALLAAENYESALEEFTGSMLRESRSAEVFKERAKCHLGMRNYDSALADLGTALDIDSTYWPAWNNRGIIYANHLGMYDAAYADYEMSIANGGAAYSYVNRARAYLDQELFDSAIADFGRAIEEDPQYIPSYEGRVSARFKAGDYAGALPDLEHILAASDDVMELTFAYRHRAWCRMRLKLWDAAEQDFASAIELSPEDNDVYHDRGGMYYFMAKDAYGSALAFDTQDAVAMARSRGLYIEHD
mgnify:CR=1 FL=1